MTVILIVDDDFDIRDTLTDVLGDAGYAVASAADGFEALQYLRDHEKPALILLDWMMPRCNGAQFREQQLADPALSDIPVVLLTADARVNLGDAERLPKPVVLDTLLEVVRRYAGP